MILSTFLHSNWLTLKMSERLRRQVQEKGGLIKSSRMKVGKYNITRAVCLRPRGELHSFYHLVYDLSTYLRKSVYDKNIFLNVI